MSIIIDSAIGIHEISTYSACGFVRVSISSRMGNTVPHTAVANIIFGKVTCTSATFVRCRTITAIISSRYTEFTPFAIALVIDRPRFAFIYTSIDSTNR